MLRLIQSFFSATGGNIATLFALSILPVGGAVGVAIDLSRASATRTAVQSAADLTALNLMKSAPSMSNADLQAAVQSMFLANFNQPTATNVNVSAQYDSATKILSVSGTASIQTQFMTLFAYPQMTVGGLAKATLGGNKKWPVCAMVTNPTSNHTLQTSNNATINFENCLVQVNTQNWDAVEARDTSYIHSTNGANCFVGDIHYGDVTPPKEASCTLFPDPFASYTVPTNTCDYTNKSVSSTATLSPGTYCGGLKITGGDVTFSPGIYYIQNGDLTIQGSANATGSGVTFLLTGSGANLNFTTTGTITMSPYTGGGQWSGFLFFYDLISVKGSNNVISSATVNVSGVLYLVGQQLQITKGANVSVNTGSILADFILPNAASLYLKGNVNSPNAADIAMRKSLESTVPVLTQ